MVKIIENFPKHPVARWEFFYRQFYRILVSRIRSYMCATVCDFWVIFQDILCKVQTKNSVCEGWYFWNFYQNVNKFKSFCFSAVISFLKKDNDVLGPGIMNSPCFGVCFEIVELHTFRICQISKSKYSIILIFWHVDFVDCLIWLVVWRWKNSRIPVKKMYNWRLTKV